MLWRFTVTFDDTKPPPEAVNGHIVLVQIFTRFGALANVIVIVIVIAIFLGQLCPRGKGA